MQLCFIEEAGCPGALPSATSNIQPVFTVCGFIVDTSVLKELTRSFIAVKREYSPIIAAQNEHYLDSLLEEIKGGEIRKHVRNSGKRSARRARLFLYKSLRLLDKYNVRVVGSVWIKNPGSPFSGTSIYTKSLQEIIAHFNHHLSVKQEEGMAILDSRRVNQNIITTHSIFTQMYSTERKYAYLAETPVFANSKNHAMLQLADIIVSGLVFPLAIQAYCLGEINSLHVSPKYRELAQRYGKMLRNLQYSYKNEDGKIVGGIFAKDLVNRRRAVDLFFPSDSSVVEK